MHQVNTVVIKFDTWEPTNPWELHIIRSNNSSHLTFELHWGAKPQATHMGVEEVGAFMLAMEPLLKEQITT